MGGRLGDGFRTYGWTGRLLGVWLLQAVAACSLGHEDGRSSPPICRAGALLTSSPVVSPSDLDAIDRDLVSIAPLGNFALPGHVFPTTHLGFYMRKESGQPISIGVYAPAELTITRAIKNTRRASDGQTPLYTDYQLMFSICSDVSGYFSLLQGLSDELQRTLAIDDDASFQCSDVHSASESYQKCSKAVDGPTLKAATLIGTAGRATRRVGGVDLPAVYSLDFALRDTRMPTPLANPNRWQPSELSFVCPFDYYQENSALQNSLYDKLGAEGQPRNSPPACGTIYWDQRGTARGVWFAPELPARPEEPHLTLAYHNMDGVTGVFALGSSVHQASQNNDWRAALGDGDLEYVGDRAYLFDLGTSGTFTNTPFEEIERGDSAIRCYEGLREQSSAQALDAVFLVDLSPQDELVFEVIPGSKLCPPRAERRFGPAALRYRR